MTFNTGNPIGSTDARDLSDNAENFDKALVTLDATWVDRLGVTRDSFEGALSGLSFYRVGTFAAGYTLTNMRQTLEHDGHEYSWAGAFPKVVAAGATPETSGGIGAGAWVDRTDVTLRNELGYVGGLHDISVSVVVGDGVTDNRLAVSAANALGRPIKFVGVSVIGSSLTITAPIVDTMQQIFSTVSVVTIDNNQPVRPEWFGSAAGNIRLAVNSLPSSGGVIKLAAKRYPRSYSMDSAGQGAGIAYLSKDNVKIIGEAAPVANGDYSALVGGTSIDGPLNIFANGFYMDKIGIDAGSEVCTRLWSGVTPDACNMATPSETGGAVSKVEIGTITVMGGGVSAQMHGLLVQGNSYIKFDKITSYTCAHGVALKCTGVSGGKVVGFGNSYEALILKSESTTQMKYAQIDAIQGYGLSSYESGYACEIQGASGQIESIDIGKIMAQNKVGALLIAGPSDIKSIHVGSVLSNTCRSTVKYSSTPTSSVIDSVIAIGTDSPVIVDASSTSENNVIGNVVIDGFYDGVNCSGKIKINSLSIIGVTAAAVKLGGTGKPLIGVAKYTGLAGAVSDLASLSLNANVTGPVTIDFNDYKIKLSGSVYVNSGTTAIAPAGSIPSFLCPSSNKYFSVPALTGSKIIIVGSNGSIASTTSLTTGDRVYLDTIGWV